MTHNFQPIADHPQAKGVDKCSKCGCIRLTRSDGTIKYSQFAQEWVYTEPTCEPRKIQEKKWKSLSIN